MAFLTHMLGPFPVGIWAVLAMLLFNGGVLTIFAQGLSLVNWDAALSIRLQEDSTTTEDPVERTVVAMSQGEAGADVIVQGTLIVLSLVGVFLRHPVGLLAGVAQGVIWIYVTFLVLFQRWMLYRWGVVSDLGRLKQVAPIMVLAAGVPGAVMIACLVANQGFFAW
jgi:hypothetical protein